MKTYDEILKTDGLWDIKRFMLGYACFIKLPDCGTCSVIFCNNEDGYEHVSVSPRKMNNMPTWNDMCVLKSVFWNDDEEVYQIHPKGTQYVNMVENCLHLWKPIGHELDELVKEHD